MKKCVGFAAFAAGVFGCASHELPGENTESASSPLATESAQSSELADTGAVEKEGEQSDRQAIVAAWDLPEGVSTRKVRQPIGLTLKNTTNESLEVAVVLQLDGLASVREQILGTLSLAPMRLRS